MGSSVNSPQNGTRHDAVLVAVYSALAEQNAEPPPPTDAQAAEIVRRARRRRHERLLARLRILRRTVLGVGLSAGILTGVVFLTNILSVGTIRAQPDPAGHSAAQRPTVLVLPEPSQWNPAANALTALADTAGELSGAVSSGRYTYTRTRSWSLDTTVADPYRGVTVRDERRWWAADRSGREAVATVGHWLPGMAPGDAPTPDPDGDIRYPKGLLPVVAPDLADNVFIVSSQLADQGDPADGPQQTLRAVREVSRYHAPTPTQRRALLQALADTGGLMTAGIVDGGINRRGLAVVVDSDNGATRDIAVFDPTDGRLLAYDTVALRSPPGTRLPTPAVSDSLIFVTAGRTDRL